MGVPASSVSIGHVGLLVRDMDRMAAFFCDVLGFKLTDKGEKIRFLSRDPRQHHQVVLSPGRPDVPEMINQLSFKVGTLEEVRAIHAALAKSPDVSDIRPITHGNAWSVYFRDPENNRIEFYCDTPWHIPQPFGRPVDFAKPVERIYDETKAMCEATPGFMPMEQYKEQLARRLAAEPAPAS